MKEEKNKKNYNFYPCKILVIESRFLSVFSRKAWFMKTLRHGTSLTQRNASVLDRNIFPRRLD